MVEIRTVTVVDVGKEVSELVFVSRMVVRFFEAGKEASENVKEVLLVKEEVVESKHFNIVVFQIGEHDIF